MSMCEWFLSFLEIWYDSVMMYKFHEDHHGEVIAEFCNENIKEESWLGLHYPATDIPQRSRDQFKALHVRLIQDVTAPGVSSLRNLLCVLFHVCVCQEVLQNEHFSPFGSESLPPHACASIFVVHAPFPLISPSVSTACCLQTVWFFCRAPVHALQIMIFFYIPQHFLAARWLKPHTYTLSLNFPSNYGSGHTYTLSIRFELSCVPMNKPTENAHDTYTQEISVRPWLFFPLISIVGELQPSGPNGFLTQILPWLWSMETRHIWWRWRCLLSALRTTVIRSTSSIWVSVMTMSTLNTAHNYHTEYLVELGTCAGCRSLHWCVEKNFASADAISVVHTPWHRISMCLHLLHTCKLHIFDIYAWLL